MSSTKAHFTFSQSTSLIKRRSSYYQRYWKELIERRLNIPCCLLVLYAIAIASCNELTHRITQGFATKPESGSSVIDTHHSSSINTAFTFVRSTLHLILYIIIGWVSDIKLGRERAIGLSLWLSWFGALLEMISTCIQFGTSGLPVNIAKYGMSSISLLFLLVGWSTFIVNIIAYGLDQLLDEASVRMRAFVHWFVWGLFVGFSSGFIGSVYQSYYRPKLTLITGVVIFAIMSLAVSCNCIFSLNFKPSGVLKDNPYKLVMNVLCYASKHKYISNRSAFTYWESEVPNRISMAKQKYGGPFPNESVESVKTFLRIIVICLGMFGFYIPFFVTYGHITVNQFEGSTESLNGYGSYLLWSICDKIVIILVPLYELILVPLFPKIEYFFLNPLRWLGIAYILIFLSLFTAFILDIAGEIVTPYDVDCTSESSQKFNISFLYFTVPLLLYGLADMISIVNGLEFIASQAPINMSGMLTGVFWFVRAFYTDIGRIINILFSFIKGSPLSCNFWILLTQLIICVVGFLIYIKAVKWYQNRVRNDESHRTIVEEKFSQRLSQGETKLDDHSENSDILTEYVIETLSS